MNSIGSDKLSLSLDDIIAREPQRYATPVTRLSGEVLSPKMYNSKAHGRMQHEPYKQGLMQKNANRAGLQWNGFGRSTKNGVEPNPCPYDHNSFIYNGVHVSENSALLSRRVGEVEIICRQQAEEYHIEEEIEDDDDDDDDDDDIEAAPANNNAKTIGVPVPIKNGRPAPPPNVRRYNDINYVKLPVHQRLGWSSADQFRKSRVENAAKFLRTRQNKSQIRSTHMNEKDKLKMHREQSRNNNAAMQVSIVNELALDKSPVRPKPRPLLEIPVMMPPRQPMQRQPSPLMQIQPSPLMQRQPPSLMQRQPSSLMQGNNNNEDNVFVAPLSRQNVACLPGGRFPNNSAASSRMSTLTNEEQILERITSVENLVNKLTSSSTMSAMSSFLPMDGAAMMGQGAVMLPVVGGGMQAYVPLVNCASTSTQERYTAFQGHIVQPQQDGGLIVQSVGNYGAPETANGRLRRQLVVAANRQPLLQHIQASISAVQAELRCNNHDRPSQETFAYRPMPHTTRSTINNRINQYPKRIHVARPRRVQRSQ